MKNNQDQRIENFYSLRPIDFPNLVKLSIMKNDTFPDNPYAIDVVMELSHKNPGEMQFLLLNFKGVTNFRFTQPFSNLLYISQIQITSITDWQWEHAKFQVTEVEDNIFSFMCIDFSAKISKNSAIESS